MRKSNVFIHIPFESKGSRAKVEKMVTNSFRKSYDEGMDSNIKLYYLKILFYYMKDYI